MQKKIRSISVVIAVLAFLAMACIGSVKGYTPDTCACRAFLGAAAAYIVTTIAAKAVVSIVIDAMVQSKMAKTRKDS